MRLITGGRRTKRELERRYLTESHRASIEMQEDARREIETRLNALNLRYKNETRQE